MSPIVVTPQQKDKALRTSLRTSFSRDPNDGYFGVQIRHRSFGDLTAEEKCFVLGQIAQLFRDMAKQADSERQTIAEEELAA